MLMVDQMVPPVEVDLEKPVRASRKRNRVLRKRGRFAFGFATGWLALCVFVSVFADLLPIKHYAETPDSGISQYRRKPGFRFDEPLGTDAVGRSELSRVIYGLRVSLLLSLGAVALAMVLGVAFGVTAGYLRGWVGRVFDLVTDTLLAYPPLMFLLALTAALRPGFRTLTIALMFLAFPTQAKVARANTLTYASREFVLAARAMGAKSRRIIVREIMPNVALPVMSISFLAMAALIVAEGSLSFLGVGIPKPTPALGGMVADGRPDLATSPHLVFVPGFVLLLTVFSLNTVGDRARARLGLREVSG
jgi:peptide/nickel transport system permease protein